MFSYSKSSLKLSSYFHFSKLLIKTNVSYCQKCLFSSKFSGPPWRVLFFGTDEFSLESVKALCTKLRTGTLMSSLGIVSKKNSVVSNFGLSENLPLFTWPVDVSRIKDLYDIGMVVSFGNLIPLRIINALPLGCINVHASLLPRWRGAAPIVHAIKSGDTETGVTIMRIHPHKFDVGEIVRQYRVPIEHDETTVELEKKLALHGSQLLLECLRDLNNSLDMAVPQPVRGITYAPKVTASMSTVDWTVESAKSVFNLHRAVSHLYLLKTSWHGTLVRLKKISLDPLTLKRLISSSSSNSEDSHRSALDFLKANDNTESIKIENIVHSNDAGKCLYNKKSKLLRVVCADGRCIVVDALQIGSKHLSAVDFYNGYLSNKNPLDWKFSLP